MLPDALKSYLAPYVPCYFDSGWNSLGCKYYLSRKLVGLLTSSEANRYLFDKWSLAFSLSNICDYEVNVRLLAVLTVSMKHLRWAFEKDQSAKISTLTLYEMKSKEFDKDLLSVVKKLVLNSISYYNLEDAANIQW